MGKTILNTSIITILFLTFIKLPLFSKFEENKIDSLHKLVDSEASLDQKLNSLIELSEIFSEQFPEQGLKYAQRANLLLANNRNAEFRVNIQYQLAKNHFKMDSIDISINEANVALSNAQNTRNEYLIGKVHSLLGSIYKKIDDKEKSIYHLEYAVANFKNINDYERIANSYLKLSMFFSESNPEKSISFCNKALSIYTELDIPNFKLLCYFQKSRSYWFINKKDESLKELQKGYDAFYKSNDLDLKIKYVKSLMNLFDNSNQSDSISFYNKLIIDLYDSLMIEEKQIIRDGLMFQGVENLASDEFKNRDLNQKNIVIFSITLLSILLFIFAFIYYKKSDESSKLSRKLTEQNSKHEEYLNEVENLVNELNETNNKIETQNRELNDKNSELEHIQQLLKKSNNDKDKFFSIIAHDLINSVFGFILETDYLAKGYPNLDKDLTKNKLELLSKYSKRLYNVLNNLLQWARTQTDRIEFEPEIIRLNELIRSNFEFYELPARMKNVELVNNVRESDFIFADKNLINTCLRNLINNAIKFTKEGGKVAVTYTTDSNYDIISISDNGIGMSKEKVEELFSDTDIITSTKGTAKEVGTGLGMILCKEFVAMHGGKLEVESVLNEGATFHIKLPFGEFKKQSIS